MGARKCFQFTEVVAFLWILSRAEVTTVQKTEPQPHNISSCLRSPEHDPDAIHRCIASNLEDSSRTGSVAVSCVFSQCCTLPCKFRFSPDAVIHWIHGTTGDPFAHSYYNGRDQLGIQDESYKGRTSLFKDQISRGNASLMLTGLQIQDQGRYQCYTATAFGYTGTYVGVEIEAPVSEVHISQEGNRITCSSEGIYPEPELTWSTIPPSNLSLQNRTRVHQTEDQLYNISSSLMVPDGGSDLTYSCTVRTQRNQRRTILNKPVLMDVSESETTISCSSADVSASSFTWRFNQSQIIVTKSEGNSSYNVSEEWRKHVEQVSESGSLTLQSLSSQLNGVYTCEVTNSQETIVSTTWLRINHGTSAGRVVGGLAAAAVVVAAVVFILGARKQRKLCFGKTQPRSNQGPSASEPTEPQTEPLNGGIPFTDSRTGPDSTRSGPGAENQNSAEETASSIQSDS